MSENQKLHYMPIGAKGAVFSIRSISNQRIASLANIFALMRIRIQAKMLTLNHPQKTHCSFYTD